MDGDSFFDSSQESVSRDTLSSDETRDITPVNSGSSEESSRLMNTQTSPIPQGGTSSPTGTPDQDDETNDHGTTSVGYTNIDENGSDPTTTDSDTSPVAGGEVPATLPSVAQLTHEASLSAPTPRMTDELSVIPEDLMARSVAPQSIHIEDRVGQDVQASAPADTTDNPIIDTTFQQPELSQDSEETQHHQNTTPPVEGGWPEGDATENIGDSQFLPTTDRNYSQWTQDETQEVEGLATTYHTAVGTSEHNPSSSDSTRGESGTTSDLVIKEYGSELWLGGSQITMFHDC